MRGMRNTGGVVSLALLASLVGHVAIHRHFERRHHAQFSSADAKQRVEFDGVYCEHDQQEAFEPFAVGRETLVQHPHGLKDQIHREVISALGQQDAGGHPTIVQVGDVPSQVPSPVDPLPQEITEPTESARDAGEASAVRGVIEHELSHATREEREIWFDELKTLPAGVVRDLLQVRKQLRALPRLVGGMPEKLASADLESVPNRSREISAEPASTRIRFNVPDQLASLTSLEAAVSQLRHNVTNAATPGFKRLRVSLVDVYGSRMGDSPTGDETVALQPQGTPIQGEGCRLAPLLIDLTQGTLKKTGRQLDLAISGEGFFVLQSADRSYLSRCGALTLNRHRQLCLATTSDDLLLQPVITIPESVQEIRVSAEGLITVVLASDPLESATVGQIQLAHVSSPARLQPVGSALFAATEGSGPVVLQAPRTMGQGEIHQGFLEQANVELEKELDEIEALTTIQKSFPSQNLRPATASHKQESPNR